MNKILIIFLLVLFASCKKDYSLDYFVRYNGDCGNLLMAKSDDFKLSKDVLYEKIGNDNFVVTLYYFDSKLNNRISFGSFNHNGKLNSFSQEQ